MKHRILVQDYIESKPTGRYDDIIWDDVVGTVEGSHYKVESLNKRLSEPFPLEFGDETRLFELQDPAHNPSDFLTLVGFALMGLSPPYVILPNSLKGVSPTPATKYFTVPDGAIQ